MMNNVFKKNLSPKPINHKRVWVTLALILFVIIVFFCNILEVDYNDFRSIKYLAELSGESELYIFPAVAVACYVITALLFILDHPKLALIPSIIGSICTAMNFSILDSINGVYASGLVSFQVVISFVIICMSFVMTKLNKKEKAKK